MTLFGSSSRRLENFARSARAVAVPFTRIFQRRPISFGYDWGVSIRLLPSSQRPTHLSPTRRLGNRSSTECRSSIRGHLKTSCVSSDLARTSPDVIGVRSQGCADMGGHRDDRRLLVQSGAVSNQRAAAQRAFMLVPSLPVPWRRQRHRQCLVQDCSRDGGRRAAGVSKRCGQRQSDALVVLLEMRNSCTQHIPSASAYYGRAGWHAR
jgi:hypothetical protein